MFFKYAKHSILRLDFFNIFEKIKLYITIKTYKLNSQLLLSKTEINLKLTNLDN